MKIRVSDADGKITESNGIKNVCIFQKGSEIVITPEESDSIRKRKRRRKGRRKAMEVSKEILKWVVSGDTGQSSLTLFALFCEMPIQDINNHPRDNGDFGRCKRFLALLDQKDKERVLAQAGKISPHWDTLVNKWEYLENIECDELWNELHNTGGKQ